MRIDAPRRTGTGRGQRIEALVVFEDDEAEPLDVFYEIAGTLAEVLEPDPEAFVLAALPAALWRGERRLRVEGALDRAFLAGLREVMALFAAWYPHCRPLAIEPTEGTRCLVPADRRHVAAPFSGGVDAMSMLAQNRRAVPLDHPLSIRTGLFHFGVAMQAWGGDEPARLHVEAFEKQARRLEALAAKTDLDLCLGWTNAARLHRDTRSYMDVGFGALALAPLLACRKKVTDAWLASSGWGAVHFPHGSHPMLEPLFSTAAVRVHSAEPLVSRFQKVGSLVDFEPAWSTVQPCHNYLRLPEGQPNCGYCEKCLRTMTHLTAWDALERFDAFPVRHVDPAAIDAIVIPPHVRTWDDPELVARLEARGRHDLLLAIRDGVQKQLDGPWGRRRRKLVRSVRKRWAWIRGEDRGGSRGAAGREG